MIGATYQRARISGTLQCCSDIHLGDGDEALFNARGKRATQKGGYSTICLGANGLPYLPGSSLRGAVLSGIEKTADYRGLFGYSNDSASGEDKRSASRVRFRDARLDKDATRAALPAPCKLPYWSAERMTCVRHGIAVDGATGSVKKGLLFRYELVPKGSIFCWTVEVERPSGEDLSKLLGLLQRLDGTPWRAIGKGCSKGLGRIEWQCEGIEVLTYKSMRQWLCTDGQAPPAFESLSGPDWPVAQTVSPGARPSFSLQVHAISPLLVNEPGLVTGEERKPKMEFSRTTDGRALVPGTSIKGLIRAHARRILATIAHQCYQTPTEEASTKIDSLIASIFGGERNRAVLWFDDLISDEPAKPHPQTFIAIDRFSGGVKDTEGAGALFSVMAACCDQMSCTCYLDQDRLPGGDWWKGLLLLVARDAMEGQLAAGWGKGKGFGVLQLCPTAYNDWEQLIDTIKQQGADPQHWIYALHSHIHQMVKV